jgi:hypothetical protein
VIRRNAPTLPNHRCSGPIFRVRRALRRATPSCAHGAGDTAIVGLAAAMQEIELPKVSEMLTCRPQWRPTWALFLFPTA